MELKLTCWLCGRNLDYQQINILVDPPVIGLRVTECECNAQTIRKLMDKASQLELKLAGKNDEIGKLKKVLQEKDEARKSGS